MNHGSLFSGFGGFDLAAEWMGWNNVFHCEIEEFPRKVLQYYWPESRSYENIQETDFTAHRGRIDVLTGGFPCQPFSVAGERKGDADDRYLWPEMYRAVRECRPRWIVAENVPGLINWSGGLVFETICIDLEDEGYKVQPVVLPAAGKGAPHKRDRVWIIAYCDGAGLQDRTESTISEKVRTAEKTTQPVRFCEPPGWTGFPTQSAVCGGNDGLPDQLDGITISAWRRESIKGFGNAIVAKVELGLFEAIEEYER